MIKRLKRLLRRNLDDAQKGTDDQMPRKKFRVFCACGWYHTDGTSAVQPVRADNLYLAIIKGQALHGKSLLSSVINIDAALNPNTPLHYIDAEEIG